MKDIREIFAPEVRGKIRAQHMAEIIAKVIEEGGFDAAHLEITKIRETKKSIAYRRERRNFGFHQVDHSAMYLTRDRVTIDSTVGSLRGVRNLKSAPGRLMRVAFNELQDLVNDLRENNTSPNLSGMISARLYIAGQAFTVAVNTTVDRSLPRLHGKPTKLPTHISDEQGRLIASRLYHQVMK